MSTLKIYDGSTWQAVGGIGSSGYSGYSGTNGTAGAVNPNIFINGDLNVWQRGTSFTSIAGTSYFADRFRYLTSAGQNVWNATRETDVPSLAQSSHLSNYSMKMACTTKEDAVAAAEVTYIRVAIEGYDYAAIAQQAFTVSFWVKAYKAGIYCFAVFNSGADRSYVAEYTINASNTWEKKTVTITASPAAGTWDYTTGVGIYMNWTILSGATYQTTANTWATGQYIATSNQVNGADSTSNTFFLSQIKLEPGSSATQFMGEPAAVELERCQRYLVVLGPGTTMPAATAFGISTTTANSFYYGQVAMRAAPGVTMTGTPRLHDGAAVVNITGVSYQGWLNNVVQFASTCASGVTQYRPYSVDCGTGTASIIISAEI
jgi:hypothetical protein